MSILSARMREVNADVCFEGTLVCREAGIPIDAEQGAPAGADISNKEGTDVVQVRREVADKQERRLDNGGLVSRFVLRELLAVVVPL